MSTMAARRRERVGNLTAAAAGRLNIVQARIDGLRRKAEHDPAAAEEYHALLEEHGRLDQILSDFRDD